MQLSRGAGAPSVQGNLLRGIVNWSGGACVTIMCRNELSLAMS